MRLWTIHPRYLDTKGLVAAWREALLAQKVLAGATKGYRRHPQLHRFQQHPNPLAAIANFLTALCAEANARGYKFDATKIQTAPCPDTIPATRGQLRYEWQHLHVKLKTRAPHLAKKFQNQKPKPHPLFKIIPGEIHDWEKR